MESVIVIAAVILVLYLVFKLFKTLLKWLLIAVVIVLGIAFFSNPDFDKHRDELKSMRKDVTREIREKRITFDDYKVFSLTRKKVDGKERIVGVGAFGKVWYFDDK